MADALTFDVPLEFGLEFVPIVRSRLPDAVREVLDDAVDEQDSIGLGVPAVDLESPRAVFVRSESLGDFRIDLLLIQRGGWRKEASLDDKATLARPS